MAAYLIILGVLIVVLAIAGVIFYSKYYRRLAQNNRIYVIDKSDEKNPQIRICFTNKLHGDTLKVYSPYYGKRIKVKLEGRDYVYRKSK